MHEYFLGLLGFQGAGFFSLIFLNIYFVRRPLSPLKGLETAVFADYCVCSGCLGQEVLPEVKAQFSKSDCASTAAWLPHAVKRAPVC